MTRVLLAVALTALLPAAARTADPQKPNVVFILADDTDQQRRLLRCLNRNWLSILEASWRGDGRLRDLG